jgi:hypothetical protein
MAKGQYEAITDPQPALGLSARTENTALSARLQKTRAPQPHEQNSPRTCPRPRPMPRTADVSPSPDSPSVKMGLTAGRIGRSQAGGSGPESSPPWAPCPTGGSHPSSLARMLPPAPLPPYTGRGRAALPWLACRALEAEEMRRPPAPAFRSFRACRGSQVTSSTQAHTTRWAHRVQSLPYQCHDYVEQLEVHITWRLEQNALCEVVPPPRGHLPCAAKCAPTRTANRECMTSVPTGPSSPMAYS